MKKLCLWVWMLTKRLYKKATFVGILVLIPVLVLAYNGAAQQDSGMITVALAQEGGDPLAGEMMASLDGSSQLLRFVYCDGPSQAEELVRMGKADTAWIFPDGMEEKLLRFAREPEGENAFVTVLVREDNVAQKLAREKLSGLIYRYCSRIVYLDYIRQNVPELAALSEEELLAYYENTSPSGELFAFDETDGAMANAQKTHYLTAPVRGMLAVVIVLCGLACAMYYMEDSRRGTFGWLSQSRRPLAELGCQLVSLGNVGAVAWLTLALTGMAGSFGRELVLLVLYCLCTASFCMLLRRLCGQLRVLGTLLPVLVVVMLLICPVFFDLGQLRPLQYLLPPTYYINGIYSNTALISLLLHTLTTSTLYLLTGKLLKRD